MALPLLLLLLLLSIILSPHCVATTSALNKNGDEKGFAGLNEDGDLCVYPPEGKSVLVNGVDVVAAVSQQQQQQPRSCDCEQQLEELREELRAEHKANVKVLQRALCDAGAVDAVSVLQSFATNGANDWEHAVIDGDDFLILASKGGSLIFRWNNVTEEFEQVQTLQSSTTDSQPFAIDGVQYLMLGTGTGSFVYAWDRGTQQFVNHQSLTAIAAACHFAHFELDDGDHFLACAKQREGSQYAAQSTLFKWNKATKQLESYQTFNTNGAAYWEAFTMQGVQYLALANHRTDSSHSILSYVFVWNNSSKQFDTFQAIRTEAATAWEHFQIEGDDHDADHFLAVSNHATDSGNTIPSIIYKFNKGSQQFEPYQSIVTIGAWSWEHLVVNGVHLLAVANHRNGNNWLLKSVIYRWNTATKQFEVFQSIDTKGPYHWRQFQINGVHYLALANAYDGDWFTTSYVYEISAMCV